MILWRAVVAADDCTVPITTLTDALSGRVSWQFVRPSRPIFNTDAGLGLAVSVPVFASSSAFESEIGNITLRRRIRPENSTKTVDLLRLFEIADAKSACDAFGYAICVLRSTETKVAWLLLGTDDGNRVWLNGRLLSAKSFSEGRGLVRFSDCIKLTISKGDNFLVVEVHNVAGGWQFAASVVDDEVAAAAKVVSEVPCAWECSATSTAEFPRLMKMPDGLSFERCAVSISDASGRLLGEQGHLTPGGAIKLPAEGIYQADLKLGAFEKVDYIWVGSPEKLARDARDRLNAFGHSEKAAALADALVEQVAWLQTKTEFKRDRNWHRLTGVALWQLAEMANRARPKMEALSVVHGPRYATSISQIDNGYQFYRLSMPSSESSVPLIIIPAPALGRPAPFMTGPLIWNVSEVEAIAAEASKHGIAVLWPGYRANPYGHPIDSAHILEVLQNVERDNRIDKRRIFLLGTCSSAMISLTMAERWPGLFAGIGLVNPITKRLYNRMQDAGSKAAHMDSYQRAMQAIDPVRNVSRLTGIPIWIVHADDDPLHGPLQHSIDFVHAHASAHLSPMIRFDNEVAAPQREAAETIWRERFIPWFATLPPREVDSKEWAGALANSLEEVVSKPFLIVRGSAGSASETQSVREIADRIARNWSEAQVSRPRVIDDKELCAADAENLNLVFIGNEKINTCWKKYAQPSRLFADALSVRLAEKSWSGLNLSFIIVVESPIIRDRRFVFIGANDIEEASFGSLSLSTDGWYDHALWRNRIREHLEGNEDILDAGIGASK